MRRGIQGLLLIAVSCQFLACSKPSNSPSAEPSSPTENPTPIADRSTLPSLLIPEYFADVANHKNEFALEVVDPVRFTNLVNDRADAVGGQMVALLGGEIRFEPNCQVVREGKIAVGQVTGLRMTVKVVLTRHLEAEGDLPAQKMLTLVMNELDLGIVCKKPALALATQDFLWSDVEQALRGFVALRSEEIVPDPITSFRSCRRDLVTDVRRFERRAFNLIQEVNVLAAQFQSAKDDLGREVQKQRLYSEMKALRSLCKKFRRKWQPFRCRLRLEKQESFLDSQTVLLPCHRVAIGP